MSRIIYTRALKTTDWVTDTVKVMLESSTSTYVPDRDHEFVGDMTNFVEISVASYARQTLANKALNVDLTKDQLEYDADDVAFGNLESGETVKAIYGLKHVTNDADSPLLWRDDGKIDVVLAADASLNATTIWVEPLEADIPAGTAFDFGGGATCTNDAALSRGDRQIACSAIAAAATAGDVSETNTDSILPAVLQNGPFNYQAHADGLWIATQRGLFAV